MKKILSYILVIVCILGLSGCTGKVDFSDFSEYEKDFHAVVDFVLEYTNQRNADFTFTVDMKDGRIKVDDSFQSPDSLSESIKKISEKGFSYIEVGEDYMIFWKDETGYYGVLWSNNPRNAISSITKGSRPYMKSRKLTDEWCEVGALDSI